MPQIEPHDIPNRLPVIPYDGHPLYTSSGRAIRMTDRVFALLRVAEMATYVLAVRFGHLLKAFGTAPSRPQEADPEISRAFARDGLSAHSLTAANRASVLEGSHFYFERLARHRDGISRGSRGYADNQLDLARHEAPDLFQLLEEVLTHSGVLAAIRWHLGCHAELRTVTAQINDEWDTYWRAHFQERGLEPPPTTFFHMDNTYGVFKVIIYLSTVHEDNGPFSYVPGTHRIPVGRLEALAQRATDIWLDTYPQERPLFLALPRFMRRKAKFGDDIAANSEWGRWLLARERVMTSSDGDVFAFDVKGVHRGGMVVKGERRILQIKIR